MHVMYVDRWNDIMYTVHICVYIYIFCSAVPFLQLFDFIYTFKMKPVLLKVTGSVALHRWLCVRRDESQYQWVATHSWICPPQVPPKKTNQDQTIWLAHEQKKTHQAVISSQLGIPPSAASAGQPQLTCGCCFCDNSESCFWRSWREQLSWY